MSFQPPFFFISDIEGTLKSTSYSKIRIGEQIIMFGNDLVLLADSSDGLTQSLSLNYCKTSHMSINAKNKGNIL